VSLIIEYDKPVNVKIFWRKTQWLRAIREEVLRALCGFSISIELVFPLDTG
jgi:hypothetical protein